MAHDIQFYQRNGIPVSPKNSAKLVWKSWTDKEDDTGSHLDDTTLSTTTTTTTNPNNSYPTTVDLWIKWATGCTGFPLVDATLRELRQTGFCTNRVRQNAASFLCKDLGVDWRAGAEWFQFLLQDHCVGANWGNWLYFAGVGSDPKHRHFRTVSQALKYDPDGTYVQQWIPELQEFSSKMTDDDHKKKEFYLRPWDYSGSTTVMKNPPIVPPETQYTWNDLQRLQQEGALLKKVTNATTQEH
jgi:deoxyribodipyrimidine photolyase